MKEKNILDVLVERNYVEQMTNGEGLRNLLDKEKISFYLGIDPTADSLHVGHFCALMVAKHLQNAGHRPIILVGGATGAVGDPSGKQELRKVLTKEDLANNVKALKEQLGRFLDFNSDKPNKAILVDNADWTTQRGYIDFLKTVGVNFNVNQMLGAECYKARLKTGLTFLEFGYMLIQANDFKHLYETEQCMLQIGGNDQWSNLIAGVDLVRKTNQKEVYSLAVSLLTTKDGKKMGKTVAGALWLDENKTSAFDFYQYFRNIGDEEIEKVFNMLTLVSKEEIKKLLLEDRNPNELKEIAAFEITKLVHGEEKATKAMEAARAIFAKGDNIDALPTFEVEKGEKLIEAAKKANFGKSNGEIKALIKQNGITLNNENVDITKTLEEEDFKEGYALLKKGKKVVVKLVLK